MRRIVNPYFRSSARTDLLEAHGIRVYGEDDVAELLRKCRENPARARKYANLILDIDPDNPEALKYLK